jgi:ferredoxin-fold anticodon binding domain-containing protein
MNRVSSGTIKSIDNDRLVLTHKTKNGKNRGDHLRVEFEHGKRRVI